ncbi:hypothetical protein RDWZM_010214 [Blomia tropicalis]|uniref:Uncharacterized protein n=1 Tax=Blomia tropicalis TaxID=40697 RepID=A0A9Q0LYB9_BLOTA|nr:hypothetical protein BLOT_011307 [Blomia tropicalis]KAJ6215714.1 hypothetical protein RDWZM_010214 [Blomia tropicalis]
MAKPLEERLRFRLLRAVLIVSNITSFILDLMILIGGKKFVSLFLTIPDADEVSIRIFAAIEATICLIALFGLVLRHFWTVAVYSTLLVLYLLCAAVFTRVPVFWFFFLGAILATMAIIFTYMLHLVRVRRQNNPYNI